MKRRIIVDQDCLALVLYGREKTMNYSCIQIFRIIIGKIVPVLYIYITESGIDL